ncbi:hypothetical protein DYH11_04125 [Candidatus Microgenomates bacterium CPR3]|nr:hypothetical protein [Candidatus Microgenomates bacterium CPR3]
MTGVRSIEAAIQYGWAWVDPDDCAQVEYVLRDRLNGKGDVKVITGVLPSCKKTYVMSKEEEDEYLVYLQAPCNPNCMLMCREQYP